MGTVLVLGARDVDQHPVSIRECHINLWIVPAFLGKLYLLDLGFFLANAHTADAIDHVQVMVPFANPDAQCLVSHMEDRTPESWRVVFGSNPPDEGVRMRAKRRERVPIPELRTHSCWNVWLDKPLSPNTENYVRLRFTSYQPPACLDLFGGWFGLGSRLRLDLRLFDYREHVDFKGLGENFYARLIPIQHSHVYFVAPHVNRPELHSPSFAYIRVLEDALWRRYLWRKSSWLLPRHRKMHVFAWKRSRDGGPGISSHRIFATLISRGFLSNVSRLGAILASIIAVIAFIPAVVHPLIVYGLKHVLSSSVQRSSFVTFLRWTLLIGLILAVVLSVPAFVDRMARWQTWRRGGLQWIDERLYALHD